MLKANQGLSLDQVESVLSTHTQEHYISIDCPLLHPGFIVQNNVKGLQFKLFLTSQCFNKKLKACIH